MFIALIGYGKMGKEIEAVAMRRGHSISCKISSANQYEMNPQVLQWADVAIEFSKPDAAFDNVSACLHANLPVVCGTTGWGNKKSEIEKLTLEKNGSFLYASNFSIGVNIFFEVNKKLASLMNKYETYDVQIEETHHITKLDAPSGTAISLATDVIDHLARKKVWSIQQGEPYGRSLHIQSFREEGVPGTHKVKYSSEIDDIEIIHTAHSRAGFALGAVLAAEWLVDKKGNFQMKDVLGL
ncbi:MAG: 4-hydroxy-tetrahydrodipicolinate reductase [Saprospiraceae bacterium]|nr:4-hydroxy-tetrahydrodipicolinate reductase [Saprospiraceae bacterium]MBK6566676.1 4-hydroxy-tetrahydrodipicolinate reductase [Saprospiraceae bacterium]MBK7522988.1 4-hydroxy-tetrahydrodipicolinate reductase [Saprospiraceae bacterium]MBK8370637.1 4-hydroxy-tetrahydrodipicolinate reductase [Saprospiraceae bacterium]MBK8546443.1 4-hydroxy-tetrahydrodipicolinate reductase [Saprospiraceae bacterium]